MQLKQFISSVFRKAGVAAIADKTRFALQYISNYSGNRSFAKSQPEFVFPPAYFIYETYTLNYKDYFEDGKQTAGEIIDLLKPYLKIGRSDFKVLDWGCGPARVVRHIPGLFGNNHAVFGCDYNDSYIKWCTKAIPEVSFIRNELVPPVDLPSNSMDAIYGLSILTHLSEKNHRFWIDELFRLLKPGGVLLITTQGNKFKDKLLPAELKLFESGGLLVRDFEKEGHRMYSAFQPETYMKQLLGNFKLLRFIAGGSAESVHALQDTWIVQKS